METIMAEPALVLPQATATVAERSSAAGGARRAAAAARLRCRAEVAPDQTSPAPKAEDDSADYTGFSMVGVAG
jgi:hypothetical protein